MSKKIKASAPTPVQKAEVGSAPTPVQKAELSADQHLIEQFAKTAAEAVIELGEVIKSGAEAKKAKSTTKFRLIAWPFSRNVVHCTATKVGAELQIERPNKTYEFYTLSSVDSALIQALITELLSVLNAGAGRMQGNKSSNRNTLVSAFAAELGVPPLANAKRGGGNSGLSAEAFNEAKASLPSLSKLRKLRS